MPFTNGDKAFAALVGGAIVVSLWSSEVARREAAAQRIRDREMHRRMVERGHRRRGAAKVRAAQDYMI